MPRLLDRTITPTENDREIAAESARALEPLSSLEHALRIQVLGEETSSVAVSLPASVVRMLNDILREMAKGNAVTLIPTDTMLSTQDAADMLNVSRPFLVQLLETGRIPYQRLGSHRRVRFQDLMSFKRKSDLDREEALRQLAQEAQELNLGY